MRMPRKLLIIPLFPLFFLLVPLIYLVYGAFYFSFGQPTSFAKTVFSPSTAYLILNTVIFAVAGAIGATLLATIYAWIIIRTNVPGKEFLRLLPTLALTMPILVDAFAWLYLLSPSIGIANLLAKQIFHIGPIFNINSLGGMSFVLSLAGVPLAYLVVEPAIRSMDPSLEEASRVCGNSVLKTLFKVTFPILLPAILTAFILIVIAGLGSFEIPFVIGQPANIYTLGTRVYFVLDESSPPNYPAAAYLSIIYVVINSAAFAAYIYLTRQTSRFVVVTGKTQYKTIHKLNGLWKYVAFLICLIILFLVFILPFSTIVLMSFTKFLSFGGGVIELHFTLENYVNLFNLSLFSQGFINSIIMGFAVAIIATFLGLILSYVALKSKTMAGRLIEVLSSVPLAFPGIVYGLALFWAFLFLPVIRDLYGTIWAMVLAIIFLQLPFCVRIISGNLIQMGDDLEESSRVVGASWGRTFARIVMPLSSGGLTNSFTYTFIHTIRELGAIVLLATPQAPVLMVVLLAYYSENITALNVLAAASVILCLLIVAVLAAQYIYNYLTRRYYYRVLVYGES